MCPAESPTPGRHPAIASVECTVTVIHLSPKFPGDVKPVGEGVSELRIDHGPGYRVYFVRRAAYLIILMCGGDKSPQVLDIETAKNMAKILKEDSDGP